MESAHSRCRARDGTDFGVELDSMERQRAVSETHHRATLAVARPGCDLQFGRESGRIDNEAVVAHHLGSRQNVLEHTRGASLAIAHKLELAELAMDDARSGANPATKSASESLVAETDAQGGQDPAIKRRQGLAGKQTRERRRWMDGLASDRHGWTAGAGAKDQRAEMRDDVGDKRVPAETGKRGQQRWVQREQASLVLTSPECLRG